MTTTFPEERWLAWIDELSQKNYVIIDDFLSPKLYASIRYFFLEKLDDFHKAGIGALNKNLINKSIRGDLTYWLDSQKDVELGGFWDLVDETIWVLNRYCYLSLSGFEFHLAHYPSGGHYDRHLDQFSGRNNRIISVVIYLNEGWQKGDGGELELVGADGTELRIKPIAQRAVMFKSAEVPHGVLKAQKSRYSLTGWLLHQPAALGGILG